MKQGDNTFSWVVSVCPFECFSVCLSQLSCLNRSTFYHSQVFVCVSVIKGHMRIIPRPRMWAISFSLFPKEIVDGIALSKTHVVSFKLLLCPKQGTGFIKLTGEFTDNFLEKPFKTKKLC